MATLVDAVGGQVVNERVLHLLGNKDTDIRKAIRDKESYRGFRGLLKVQTQPWEDSMPVLGPIHTLYYRRGYDLKIKYQQDIKMIHFRFLHEVIFDGINVKEIVRHFDGRSLSGKFIEIRQEPVPFQIITGQFKAIKAKIKKLGNKVRDDCQSPPRMGNCQWFGGYLIFINQDDRFFILSDEPIKTKGEKNATFTE